MVNLPARLLLATLCVALPLSAHVATAPTEHRADPATTAASAAPVRDAARAQRPARISAGPEQARVESGTQIVIRGVVETRRPLVENHKPGLHAQFEGRLRSRIVQVQELAQWGGWDDLKKTRTTRKGQFAITIPADGPAVRRLRVVAPRVFRVGRLDGLKYLSANPMTVTVADRVEEPTYEIPVGDWDPAEYPDPRSGPPAGDASDYAMLFDSGSRWNPCQVIRWAYNPTGSYAGSMDDMKRAFARIAGLSGLRFKYVGETTHTPFAIDTFPTDVDIAVAWSTASQDPSLTGAVTGLASASGRVVEGADVTNRLYQGAILLDAETRLATGYTISGPTTWGQVMTHEALHAVGLHHAQGPDQIMNPYLSPTNHRFGAGDIAGMTRIGASQGCLS